MNDLQIIIQAILKSDSIPKIKEQLDDIKKKYENLNINIKIDDSIIKTLQGFTQSMEKFQAATEAQNRIVKESKTIITELDGTTKTYTKTTDAMGQEIERTRERIDKRKKAIQEEIVTINQEKKSVEELIAENEKYNQSITDKRRFNPQGNLTGSTHIIGEDGTANKLNIHADNEGNVIKYEEVENQLRNEKLAIKEHEDLIKKAEAIDKSHFLALRDDQSKTEALEKLHYLALQKNRDLDLKNQEQTIKASESLDRAHYQALKTNQERIEAQDKMHYLALQKNAEFDSKQTIAQRKLGTNVGSSPKFGLDFTEAQNYAKTLTGIDAELRNIGYSFNSAGEKLQTLNIRTKEGGKYHKEFTATLNETTGQTHLFEKGLSDVSNRQLSIAERFKTMAQSIPLWMIGMTGFMSTLHFFTEGIKYVAEFNNTLTQIGTAVNYSQDKLASLGQQFQILGKELNASTKDVAAGALEFYRQGLGDQQVLDRLKITTQYAKVSGLEFKQSAELLTAASTSMHTDINKVADTFTLLGDLTATSASEIGIAFQKVG